MMACGNDCVGAQSTIFGDAGVCEIFVKVGTGRRSVRNAVANIRGVDARAYREFALESEGR